MLVRIVRELTPEEVLQRIKHFEEELGMHFDDFEELFLDGKVNRHLTTVYFEWANLVHAYHGYVEGGELDYMVEETKDLPLEEASSLTPKRIELLYSLVNLRANSINELARKARRNIKNIYQDLKVLEKLGLIKLRRNRRRNVVPEVLVKEFAFIFR